MYVFKYESCKCLFVHLLYESVIIIFSFKCMCEKQSEIRTFYKKKIKNITRMIYKIKTNKNINILHTIKNCMKYNILNYTHTLWDIWEHMQINYTQRNFNKIHEFKISKLRIGRKYHLTIDFWFVLIPKRH